jgi:hypothetical protein
MPGRRPPATEEEPKGDRCSCSFCFRPVRVAERSWRVQRRSMDAIGQVLGALTARCGMSSRLLAQKVASAPPRHHLGTPTAPVSPHGVGRRVDYLTTSVFIALGRLPSFAAS